MSAIRDLGGFTGEGYDRGRGVMWQVAWMLASDLLVTRWWLPGGLRVRILRAFGARIGEGVNVRHDVKVHWPWKLTIGDNSWIGEEAWILNLEPVTIGSNVCISQGALLCTGSHNRRSPTFEFDNGPIVVEDSAWIAARATILRGSVIGHHSVIGAAALVSGAVDAGSTVLGPRATGLSSCNHVGTSSDQH